MSRSGAREYPSVYTMSLAQGAGSAVLDFRGQRAIDISSSTTERSATIYAYSKLFTYLFCSSAGDFGIDQRDQVPTLELQRQCRR